MMKRSVWLVLGLVFLLSAGMASATGILENTICYNSVSCEQNLQDILWNGTNGYGSTGRWNTTYLWSGGDCVNTDGVGCLQVPKFETSNQCVLNSSSLSSYGSGACSSSSVRNASVNVMVTDELSEVGIAICAGNASAEPYAVAYMNTLESVTTQCSTHQDLQGWSVCLNYSDIQCLDGNDASDAVHRNVQALYLCANNSAFSAGNRTRAYVLASTYMNQSIAEDTTGGSVSKVTVGFGTLSWWLFAGGSQASFSGSPEEDQYGGYYGDALLACVAHSVQNSGNVTLRAVCGNWTAQFLAMSNYAGGTGPSNFASPFVRIWFNESGGVVRPGPPSGFGAYYNGGARCDDADCPRFMNVCHALDMANRSGLYDISGAPWKNLSDECTAFSKTGWVGSTSDAQACQAYDATGACVTGPYDTVRLVGMLSPSLTWFNRTQFVNLTSEMNRHWSWATNSITDGGVTCGSPLSYDAVRWPKSLIVAVGDDEGMFTGNVLASLNGGGGGGGGSSPYVGVCVGPINVTVNAPLNNSNTTGSSVLLNVTVFNLNNTDVVSTTNGTFPHLLYNSSLCSVDPGFSGDTFSAGTCSINWSSGNMFSADYDMETNYPRGVLQLLVPVNYSGGNNNKLHPTSDCSSVGGNNRFNFESQNATHFHVKADRGGFSSTGNYFYNVSIIVNFTTNFTSNTSKACVGADCTGWEAFTREAGSEDCWSWEVGTPGGGVSRFNNFSITELVTAYNVTNSTSGNSSMNITFYAGNNSFLVGQNSTVNASSFTYNWSTVTQQNYSFYVTVKSKDNVVNCTNLSFSVVSSPAGPSLGEDIPINMTSNAAPSPFAVWSVGAFAPSHCWKMFDNNTVTPTVAQCQVSLNSSSNFVAVDLGKNYSIVNYTIYSNWTVASGLGTSRWTIEGSVNNVSWEGIGWNGTSDAWTTLRTYSLGGGTYRYLRITNMSTGNDHVIDTLSFGVLYLGDPAPVLSINLSDEVSGEAIGGFCINATGTNTTQHLCTSGNTVSFNTSGTYNITWFNISAGNTSPRWYNVTLQNFVFSSTQTISNVTYQELLNVSASRVLSNASIQSFNVSNDRVSNTTTTGSVLVKARNGTNNVLVGVAGNYSLNISCSGASPFTVNVCNATGVYDSILNLGARSGGSAVTNYALVVNSSVFGSLFSGSVVLNKTLYVLQGYDYGVNFTKSLYSSNVTTLTITNNSVLYNATINPTSLNVVFLDELNRSLVTGVNITAAILFANGDEEIFSTTNGSLSVVGVLDYGSYTIRYGAAAYSLREYTFTLDSSGVNLTLYMIPSSTYAAGVVTVDNFDGLPVSGATVYLYRYYGDPTIPNVVQTAVTGSDGTTVMTAEAITAYYTFRVDVDGVMRFNTTTPELLTLQADGLWYKTFTLSRNATENMSRYAGFGVLFSPASTGLANGTAYNFSVDVSSSIWDITGCELYVLDMSDGSVVAGPYDSFCYSFGGTGSVSYTTTQTAGRLRVVVNVTTDYFTNSYYEEYGVYLYSNESATLVTFVDDLSNFGKSGFGGFGRFLLAFLVIGGIVFSVARTGVLVGEPEGLLILITMLVVGFSYIGWVSVPLGLDPANPVLEQWVLAILTGIIALVALIRRWGGFE